MGCSTSDLRISLFFQLWDAPLLISHTELSFVLQQGQPDPRLLSVTLWRYGFIPLEKLEQIFEWLSIA
ncbi:MAG: DUF2949 domain-containing protein [Synechococcales cyanobacterium CRU_2_2]|nr:DUF2949 domain-containing protein [Synechococcales cyanobacterium CRU_2_2]